MTKMKTTTGLSLPEVAFHWVMSICTCGVWYVLVYRPRKRHAERTSVTEVIR